MRSWNLLLTATVTIAGLFSVLGVSDVAVKMIQALFMAALALGVLSVAGSRRHVQVRARQTGVRGRGQSAWISFRER